MKVIFVFFIVVALAESYRQKPAVLISILIRNKAHVLPYFFTYLENLDYPKDRLGLWIRSDHNDDRTVPIIDSWLNITQGEYHVVNKKYKMSIGKRAQESSPTDWPYQRLAHIMSLKEEALRYARDSWFDYIFFLDADVILTNNQTLNDLIEQRLPLVAPLLKSDGGYTNFWDSIEGEVKTRTERHDVILGEQGSFVHDVDCVANAILVDLNIMKSDLLTFEKKILNSLPHSDDLRYNGPFDPDLVFCTAAKFAQLKIRIVTYSDHRVKRMRFGYVLPPTLNQELEEQSLTNILIDIVQRTKGGLDVKPYLQNYLQYPKPDTLGLTRVFVINLDRRTDLRHYLEQQFKVIGLNAERFPAIDGKDLTQLDLNNMGINILPGYLDPYHKRPIKLGEIGCFMSHFSIWKKIVKLNISMALIVEDDVKFLPDFKERASLVIEEAKNLSGWDLLYFGRKWMSGEETQVEGSENFLKVGYSYWTVAYVLTLDGARKLIASKPLENLLPVDEFLPIMYGQHPNSEWSQHYENRNVNAWAVSPNLAEPLYYTKDEGYISETEQSDVVD